MLQVLLTVGILSKGLKMTYNASATLISHKNRVTLTDDTITTHEGVDVSAYSVINSSLVSFASTTLATDIIYRFSFYINPYQIDGPSGRNCRTHFKLQKDTGSGFADIAGAESNEIFESTSSQPMCQRLMTLRFRLAPNSSNVSYRVVAKSFSSSYRSALHYTHFWSGYGYPSGTTANQKVYYPTVEIYETR